MEEDLKNARMGGVCGRESLELRSEKKGGWEENLISYEHEKEWRNGRDRPRPLCSNRPECETA